MELYIFSQDDELLTIITESNGLITAPFRDELNRVSDTPLEITVDAQAEYQHIYTENGTLSNVNQTQLASMFIGIVGSGETEKVNVTPAQYVKEENRVVFRDREDVLREYVIKEIDDIDNVDTTETTATCIPAWVDELSENFVLDKRYSDKTAQLALNDALDGTRYTGEVHGEFSLASTNFYRISSVDAIFNIIDTWGGDVTDEVVLDDKGRIAERKIIVKHRLGADNGLRFEIDHNINEIQRTILSYPLTAMYGWGASLETEGGGHTRYIDFKDVVWRKSAGDPVDKPKGQAWVGDPEALQQYGRLHDGQLLHRYGEFSNQDYEDANELLWATWQSLQHAKKPEVNYRLSVDLLDKPASLGDGAIAIDREFARPIEIQTRIIAIEYDLVDIENTTVVEMGQHLDLADDRIGKLEEELDKNRDKWEHPTIDNGSFPDIKPAKPTNVKATGAFQTIMLTWDYESSVYIADYEVYGSQVADFVPDSQHLLWRGKVSAFSHEVETDETWYYYVRGVNTRGTAGNFSDRVSASTVRIMTDDMLFGSVNADILADLAVTSDKLDALAVKNQHIDNAAITNAKIDRLAVDTAQIQDAAITTAKIKDLAVDNAKISDLDVVKLNAGILDAGKIKVKGGSGTNYTEIDGSQFTSRGQFARTWLGESEIHDVSISTLNGRMRFHNNDNGKNLYVSDFGIGTYFGGANAEDGGYAGSGLIEFFSHRYNPDVRGLTLYSNRGTIALETDTRDIVLNANRYLIIENDNLYTDRISTKASSTNFYVGVSGEDDGELRVTNKLYWQGGNTRYMPIRARGVHGKWFVSPDNFMYLGSDSGVRVTSRGVNNLDPIIYRDIQAKDFQTRSSRKSKDNIRTCTINAVNEINSLNVVEFDDVSEDKNAKKNRLSVIAEDSPRLSDTGEFVSLTDSIFLNMKATQELSQENEELKERITRLEELLQ